MKKWFIGIAILLACISFSACDIKPSARAVAEEAQENAAQVAAVAVPIPTVSYFQEKRTIAQWATRWDKPSVATYVYLVSFGKVLGYYVANGKPASTRSYLMPEQKVEGGSSSYVTVDAPDIDGTNSVDTNDKRAVGAVGK